MKTYSSAITAYRAAGKAFLPVDFISIRVKALEDPEDLTWVHFCTADEDMTIDLVNPDNGNTISRTFLGGGHIVALPELVRSEGAVIQSHAFTFSGASDDVLNIVHGHNCREAPFQWFVGECDQDTGLLLDMPACELVGFINAAEVSDGAIEIDSSAPAESVISILVDSLAAALTARNYAMRSQEASESRSDDLFYQFTGSAPHWSDRWGKEKKSEKDRKGGSDKDNTKPGDVGRPDHT